MSTTHVRRLGSGDTMNHLAACTTLHNRYVVLRHGESVANRYGLIVSNPRSGCFYYGLTAHGRQQVRASVLQNSWCDAQTHIYSSDFRRTQQTAVLAQQTLQTPWPITYDTRLRERFFGHFDFTTHRHYQRVWEADERLPGRTQHAIESTTAVLERVTHLVLELETQWQDQTFLLVSHGDVLQILQTAFGKCCAVWHRRLPSLQPGEMRALPFVPTVPESLSGVGVNRR